MRPYADCEQVATDVGVGGTILVAARGKGG
jgi:hypothetical protein